MAKLNSRQKSIPGGFRFFIPQLGFRSRPGSFDNVVQQALAAMKGNSAVAAKMGWTLTYEAVAEMVDTFNAAVCQANGWTQYYQADGGQSVPFQVFNPDPAKVPAALAAVASVKKLAAGAALLFEWEESSELPVEEVVAENRAGLCAICPKNNPEHVSRYFTQPVSNLIRTKMARLNGLNLKTSHDDKLGICDACLCPLKLKVWTPLHLVLKHLTPASRAELWPQCWIQNDKADGGHKTL